MVKDNENYGTIDKDKQNITNLTIINENVGNRIVNKKYNLTNCLATNDSKFISRKGINRC